MENIGIHSNPADSRLRDIRAARSLDCLSGQPSSAVEHASHAKVSTNYSPRQKKDVTKDDHWYNGFDKSIEHKI